MLSVKSCDDRLDLGRHGGDRLRDLPEDRIAVQSHVQHGHDRSCLLVGDLGRGHPAAPSIAAHDTGSISISTTAPPRRRCSRNGASAGPISRGSSAGPLMTNCQRPARASAPPNGAGGIHGESRHAAQGLGTIVKPRARLALAPRPDRHHADPAERRIAQVGAQGQLLLVEGPPILVLHGLHRVVVGMQGLNDEAPIRAHGLGGGPRELEGALASRKSGMLRRLSSVTMPTNPSRPGAEVPEKGPVPTTTWARGSLRETVSLGNRLATAASTRSGSQPKGDNRCPPQCGHRSGTARSSRRAGSGASSIHAPIPAARRSPGSAGGRRTPGRGGRRSAGRRRGARGARGESSPRCRG